MGGRAARRPRALWLWGIPLLALVGVEIGLYPLGGFRRIASRNYATEETWLTVAHIAAQMAEDRRHPSAPAAIFIAGSSTVVDGVDRDQLAAALEASGGAPVPIRMLAYRGAQVTGTFLLIQLTPAPGPRALLLHLHPRDFADEGIPTDDTVVARMLAHGGLQWPVGPERSSGRVLQLRVAQYWQTYRHRLLLQRMGQAELGVRLGLLAPPTREADALRAEALRSMPPAVYAPKAVDWRPDRPGNAQAAALEQLLQWCRERGVPVVFFSAPLCPTCNNTGPYTEADIVWFRSWLADLAHRRDLVYLDYTDLPVTSVDFAHVDVNGRAVLTQQIAADLGALLGEEGSL